MVRQAKIFTTLMENFDTVNRSVATSLNSAGSAMRENEVYTQSLEGKINALKSSFEQLATTTINSDMVKGIIDMTTEMIKFVDASGGLIPILTSILGIIVTIKAQSIGAFLTGMLPALKTMATSVKNLGFAFSNATTAIKAYAVGTATLSTTIQACIPVIGLLTVAISGVIMAYNNWKQAEAEKVAQAKEEIAQYNSQREAINSLVIKYKELEETGKKDKSTKEELINIQKQLADHYGTEARGLDLVNKSYEENIDVINRANEAKQRQLELNNSIVEADLEKEMNNTRKTGNKRIVWDEIDGSVQTAFEELSKSAKEALRLAFSDDGVVVKIKPEVSNEEALKALDELLLKMELSGEKGTKEYNALASYYLELSNAVENYTKAEEDNINAQKERERQDNLAVIQQQAKAKGIEDITEATRAQIKALEQAYVAEMVLQHGQDSATEAQRQFKEAVMGSVEAYDEYMKASTITSESIDKLAGEQEKVDKMLEDFRGTTLNTLQGVELLNNSINSLADGQTLTGETILKLITQYPQLRSQVVETNGVYTIQIGVLEDLRNATIEEQKASIEANIEKTRQVKNQTLARIKMYQTEAQALMALATAQSSPLNRAKDIGGMDKFFNKEREKEVSALEQKLNNERANLEELNNIIAQSQKALEDIDYITSSGNTKKGSNISNKKKKDKDKSNTAKVYTKLIDEQISVITSKTNELERALDFANEKLQTAVEKGDTKLAESIYDEIASSTQKKQELLEQTGKELREIGAKVQKDLMNMNISALKGKDLTKLTGLDVAKINQAFEKQIEKATESNKASLEQRKSDFNEYANAIIKIYQEELPEASRTWWTLESELIEQNTQKLTRAYEKQMSDLDKALKGIDLEQVFMTDGSDEWFASELKRIDIIYEKKVKTEEMIRKLKEQNYSEESKEMQSLMSQAEDYELQMRQLIRQRAEARKSEKISSLNKELENYKEQEKAITTLHDMVMQMLKDEQSAKKEALEEERDLMRKRIQEEIDGYEKIINKKKESLRKEQSDRNYEKGLKERQKKIADTEKKIADLSADKSNASQAEKKRLEAELQQYREDLEDYQYDHSIEMREEALDKELEAFKDEKEKELKAYEEQLDKQLKEIEEFVKNEGKLREEALKLIEEKNRELYDRLIAWNKEYGVTNACPPSTEMCFEKHTYMQVSPKALHYNT